MTDTRLYWLSFVATGGQFLGVAIVEVDDADWEFARDMERERRPWITDEAVWIVAAIAKAWRLGCNPGGSVGSTTIDPAILPAGTPIGVLMSRDELRKWELIP
jgi:hypothetical protein